jgi:predicted small secreted protein
MKKNFLSIAILAIVISLSSCGSSSGFEKDVRKKAEYMCSIQKLTANASTDEKVAKELEVIQKEMDEFDSKMEEKYKDKKNDEAMSATAQKIMMEVMAKCK